MVEVKAQKVEGKRVQTLKLNALSGGDGEDDDDDGGDDDDDDIEYSEEQLISNKRIFTLVIVSINFLLVSPLVVSAAKVDSGW